MVNGGGGNGGETPYSNNMPPNLDLPFPKPLPPGITFSFSAGGWLQMYMFGVCHALQQSGVIDHYNNNVTATDNNSNNNNNNKTSSTKDDDENNNNNNDSTMTSPQSSQQQQFPSSFTTTDTRSNTRKRNNNLSNLQNSNNSNNNSNNNNNNSNPVRFVGASAGALAASCLAADLDMNEVKEFTLESGEHMNSKWYYYFFMKDYVDIAIDKFATDIMARDDETGTHEVQDRLRKNLGIYCTVLPWFQKKKFNEFTSKEDVKEALFASLCAAPMVGFPFRLRSTGELVVDGGIAAFQPKSGRSNVITVSPFYFANADIRPSHFLPMHYAFRPPSRKAHAALFDLGYNDAIDFLVRKQFISPQNSANIRLPDPKAPRRSVFAIFKDFAFLLFTYILIRPLAIIVVYLEMLIMASYYFLRTLLSSSNGGATIVDWLETMANLCSPSVFMHMAVSHRIPVNEKRLSKRSISFRVFAPIFGTPHDEEDGGDENSTNRAGGGGKKKRFAVHTPVGTPNQTQLLFDRFRNLGWSGGSSMFKEEDGRTIYTNNNSNSNSNSTTPLHRSVTPPKTRSPRKSPSRRGSTMAATSSPQQQQLRRSPQNKAQQAFASSSPPPELDLANDVANNGAAAAEEENKNDDEMKKQTSSSSSSSNAGVQKRSNRKKKR